jgi:hypothetical protein
LKYGAVKRYSSKNPLYYRANAYLIAKITKGCRVKN